jgi:uncharacterized protein (TIGR00369 family)
MIARIPLLSFLDMKDVASPEPGVFSVTMDLTAKTNNLMGAPHGGAIASLIDHTGGHAAGVLLGRSGPTVDLHIRYLTTPHNSAQVRADARIVREGRTLIVVAVDVYDEEDRLLATGSLSVAARPGRPEPSPD